MNEAPTSPRIYLQALGLEPVQYGPSLPIAWCKCGHQFTFERTVWRPRVGPRSTGWRCQCDGCVDGEYLEDGLHTYVRSGEGESPWEALDNCAAMQWDITPEELLEKP